MQGLWAQLNRLVSGQIVDGRQSPAKLKVGMKLEVGLALIPVVCLVLGSLSGPGIHK